MDTKVADMKCFTTNSNAIVRRLDCFYYQPDFVELEKKISELTNKKLGDFIISIAGGATPDKNEVDRYYTDSDNGVPFLRVQNVTPEGLNLENLVFINQETNNNMLKRSQVKEHYLVTKITGVGRMAVSSVVPPGFEGNINQHLVAIKTKSPEVSRVLAAFLNSDIGERLASRRSTGGTRPALDYEALKAIPIIFEPQIVDIMQSAYSSKRQKEAEAQKLLDSIDEYLLGELKIHFDLKSRTTFVTYYKDLTGRLDPYFYYPEIDEIKEAIKKRFGEHKFAEVIDDIYRYPTFYGLEYQTSGIPVIKGENINKLGWIELNQDFDYISSEIHDRFYRTKLKNGDLLFTVRGIIGKVGLFNGFVPEANINANLIKISIKKDLGNPIFFCVFLNSSIGQALIQNLTSGQVQKTITVQDIKDILIPLPTLEVQNSISSEIQSRIMRADEIQKQANTEVDKAKAEVERLILGNRRDCKTR